MSFLNVPGATTAFTVPADQKALVLVRFAAEASCSGGNRQDWCSVRVLVDGHEALPNSGVDYAFDTDDGASEIWHGASLDRSVKVGSGLHHVTGGCLKDGPLHDALPPTDPVRQGGRKGHTRE
jgi:hypothetical protein